MIKQNISVLKDYCENLTDTDADALLACWGVWVNTAKDYLGYKSPKYAINAKGSSACIWLNDRELELIDQAVGMLANTDKVGLAVIKSKFIYRMTMRGMVKRYRLNSTNKVYGILNGARNDFKFFLKQKIEDKEGKSA